MNHYGDGVGCVPDCFHASVCLDECVELDGELRGLWSVEPASVVPAFDEGFYEECQFDGEGETFGFVGFEAVGKEVDVIWVETGSDCTRDLVDVGGEDGGPGGVPF